MNCTNSLKSSPSCSLKYNESFSPYLFWCQNAFMLLWKHILPFVKDSLGELKSKIENYYSSNDNALSQRKEKIEEYEKKTYVQNSYII